MDTEDLSLKMHALLRRAGLEGVPKPVLIGIAIIGLTLVLWAAWHFWPRANAEFVATTNADTEQASEVTGETEALATQEIVVDVEGAVMTPGLYTLGAEARVGDAVEAAGGLSPDAREGAINLAQRLEDGEQVVVASVNDAQAGAQGELDTASSAGSTGGDGKIDINTASAEELQQLSGVGPSLSQRIIDYRESNGKFKKIEDLQNVSGIGETRFANIKDKIRV